MLKKLISFFFAFAFLLINVGSTYAHVGGVAFLKINEKYSPANPNYYSSPELKDNIPQDFGAEKYLVGQPITMEIDTSAIPVAKELIDQAIFRWTFDDGSTTFDYGLKVTHTYQKTGSHIASLDIKAPEEAEFTPYDTIQLDVVPSLDYQLPKGVITVTANKLKTGEPIQFESRFNTNPQATITDYYWFVDGEKIASQPIISHRFPDQDFFQLVFLKYTDSFGFSAYSGAWLEGISGEIKLEFPPNSHDDVIISSSLGQSGTASPFKLNTLWLIVGVLLTILVALYFKFKKKPL